MKNYPPKAGAGIQYEDMEGTISVDWRDKLEIVAFAKEKGVDTERYDPVALEVEIYEADPMQKVTLLAVDKERIGSEFESYPDHARANAGCIPTVEFKFTVSLPELLKYIKRISMVIATPLDGVTSHETYESRDVEEGMEG